MLELLKSKSRIFIVVLVIAFSALASFSTQMDYNLGYTPEQPIAYSHKLHAGDLEIDCLYCHSNAEKGPHATVPPMSTCMGCHSVVATSSPEIKKLAAYYEKGMSVPWVRIHRLPDHVYFTHQIHLNAEIKCQTCHGEIQEMPVVGQARLLEMGDCLSCHRDENYARKSYETNPEFAQTKYSYLRYVSKLTKSANKKLGSKTDYKGKFHQATGIKKYQNAPTSCDVCHQ